MQRLNDDEITGGKSLMGMHEYLKMEKKFILQQMRCRICTFAWKWKKQWLTNINRYIQGKTAMEFFSDNVDMGETMTTDSCSFPLISNLFLQEELLL